MRKNGSTGPVEWNESTDSCEPYRKGRLLDVTTPPHLERRLRNILASLILILLIGFTVSCGGEDHRFPKMNREDENVLRFDVNTPFSSLNPEDVQFSGSTFVFPLLYSYLFFPDSSWALTPDLAKKWNYDPQTFTWTIHIRDDATFHNRQKLTAKDVEHSLETVLKARHPELFGSIKQISTASDNIVHIQLEDNDAGFLEKIFDSEIIPRGAASEFDAMSRPIGSGPFIFSSRDADERIVLKANPDYYSGPPDIDLVRFMYQPEKEKTWTRLLEGETDIAQEISPENYEMMKRYEDRFWFDHYTLRAYTIMLFNTSCDLFRDPGVREALSMAIDREYIVNNILRGYGRIALGPMVADSPYHDPEIASVAFSPSGSDELLNKAGWLYDSKKRRRLKGEKPFEFTLLLSEESRIQKQTARYIQLCLNDLGVRVKLKILPFKDLLDSYWGNNRFESVLTEFNGIFRNPDSLRGVWSSDPGRISKAGGFYHPEVNRLIEEACKENDQKIKEDLFRQVEARIIENHPGAFLYHKTALDVMSRRFSVRPPFSLTLQGVHNLKTALLNGS